MKLGLTGEFPEGKLNEDDEGALLMRISEEGGKVRLDFGTPVSWMAMPPAAALSFANSLIEYATAIMQARH